MVVIQLPCAHIDLFACLTPLCVSVPSLRVHMYVYMASSEPMVGELLLIGKWNLIYVSLNDTLLCQASIADHSHYTHCACGHTYENLHSIAHRYCSPNVSYDTAIARSPHMQ